MFNKNNQTKKEDSNAKKDTFKVNPTTKPIGNVTNVGTNNISKSSVEKATTAYENSSNISNKHLAADTKDKQGINTTVTSKATVDKKDTKVNPKTNIIKKAAKPRVIKPIRISKIGSDHLFSDKNNQDYIVSLPKGVVVCDGCGSSNHSEVGTRLFGQFIEQRANDITPDNFIKIVTEIFKDRLIPLFENTPNYYDNLIDNFAFTILACFETDKEFIVLYCGDGFIITSNNKELFLTEIDDNNIPPYYIYNYIDPKILKCHKRGTTFNKLIYKKSQHAHVGIASDGIRYYTDLNTVDKNKFLNSLLERKRVGVGMILNKYSNIFKDDTTIGF